MTATWELPRIEWPGWEMSGSTAFGLAASCPVTLLEERHEAHYLFTVKKLGPRGEGL
jgi:hypothetical protein